jgi:hypothetical protein
MYYAIILALLILLAFSTFVDLRSESFTPYVTTQAYDVLRSDPQFDNTLYYSHEPPRSSEHVLFEQTHGWKV